MSITTSAAANIADGYLQLASRYASPFLLSMKHAAYMAFSIVLLDLDRVLPVGPWLATAFATAWSFADACAARILVAIRVVVIGVVGVVFLPWIRLSLPS